MSRMERLGFVLVLIVALVASAGLVGVLGGNRESHVPRAAADTPSSPPSSQHAISVTGEGRVYATPDTGQVTLGVQIQDADLSAAQTKAAQTMDAIQSAVKSKGVPDSKIKTVTYNVTITHDPQKPGQPVTGYMVTDLISVSVKPVAQLGGVLQAAIGAGANQVQGVSFVLEDTDAAIQQARQQAMNDAHNKAQQLAQLGGVTLGAPVTISEGISTPPTPQPLDSRAAVAGAVPSAAPSIQPGETQIVATVTVSYGF